MRLFSLADSTGLQPSSSSWTIPAAVAQSPNGHAAPTAAPTPTQARPNDPLAGMTLKQTFFQCIWLSKESTATKLMLVCIWRFFDANARSSSMSYTQIAADCTIHENSAKRIARDILGKWLTVGVQKGFKTGSGKQNLYHGICPPDLVEELRELKRKGKDVEPDEDILAAADAAIDGVASRHPFDEQGAASGYPLGKQGVASGYPSGQGVTSEWARGNITGGVTLDTSLDGDKDSGAHAPGVGATQDLFSGGVPDQGRALPKDAPNEAKGGSRKKVFDAEIEAGFLEWYKAYPRKEAPKDAKRAYARIIKSGEATIPQILAAVKAYKFAPAPIKGERDFRPHPARWLNGGYWQVVAVEPDGTAQHTSEDAWVAEQMRSPKGIERAKSMGREACEKMLREVYRQTTGGLRT
jgi:hypothetical protein